MNMFLKTVALGAALTFLPGLASAGQRYAPTPALTLNADVSSPWILQIRPKHLRSARRTKRNAKRQYLFKREQKQVRYNNVQTDLNTRRSGITTASVCNQAALRGSVNSNFKPDLLPTIVNYNGTASPGTLIVNTVERRLYLVQPGGKARRYAVGVGKPGFEWAGTHKVTRKAEWPSWRPPASMIAREKKKGRILPAFMAGGVKNPLGARALYLGSTIYRIHGTNQAWSIGKAVSSGCIRMRNEDVMDLYDRVPIGAKVKVI